MPITKKLLNKIVTDESTREDLNAIPMVNPDRTRLNNYFKGKGGGGIPEADKDGNVYGRCNGNWVKVPKTSDVVTIRDNDQRILSSKRFMANIHAYSNIYASFNKIINSDNDKSLIYYFTAVSNSIGDLTDLDTTDKANLVKAINEIVKVLENHYTKTETDAKFVGIHKMGVANGIATLNEEGKISSAQLPSFVDGVGEYANLAAFPITGGSCKIYVAYDTNKIYRWGGTSYVEISESLALGETSSTAYAGDKGKQNADDIEALQNQIGSHQVHADVPAGAKFTDTITEVIDNLTSSDAIKALSAKQGKVLKDIIDALVVDNLTTEDETKALSAKQGKLLKALIENGGCLVKKGTNYNETKAIIIGGDGESIASGENAVVISGDSSNKNEAKGPYSIAEGKFTKAYGEASHAEGYYTIAGKKDHDSTYGKFAHAEGIMSYAQGYGSHAEGNGTTYHDGTAYDDGAKFAHAEGGGIAIGNYSHAEGNSGDATLTFMELKGARGECSHAEGYYTIAEGKYSHAEGYKTKSIGFGSHAEGNTTKAEGYASHAEGRGTIATNYCQHVVGTCNKTDDISNPTSYSSTSSAIIIGNAATTMARSNCFRVTFNGNVYGLSAFNSSGADYAEYFEWEDGNINKEDRIGYFVSLNRKGKISIADGISDIIGVVSGMSSIIGNASEDQYHDMYLKDIYGRFIYEDVEVERESGEYEKDEQGEYKRDKKGNLIPIMETVTEHRMKINPEYDPSIHYIPRSQRPEWDVIGLLGQVVVIDDGTCIPGQKCSSNSRGIATNGDKYRVLKRLDENHILVLANFLN